LATERRGGGIYQHSLDEAIRILQNGGWVHLFPEGFVNQPELSTYEVLKFRWGISRILLEAPRTVNILPISLKGFDKIMPEGRSGLAKFVPRIGQEIEVLIADRPIDRRNLIDQFLDRSFQWTKGEPRPRYKGESAELSDARIKIAHILREQLCILQSIGIPN